MIDQRFIAVALSAICISAWDPAAAETCEVTTSTCLDTRTGLPRVCMTTTCKNELGEVTSTNTIILRGTKDTGEGKRPLIPKAPPAGAGATVKQ
jgi:hypothetical protein